MSLTFDTDSQGQRYWKTGPGVVLSIPSLTITSDYDETRDSS